MKDLIAKIKNTRDYENLNERLGPELGGLIYQLVAQSEKADKELDIVHRCITDLYDIDLNAGIIKKTLLDIKNI